MDAAAAHHNQTDFLAVTQRSWLTTFVISGLRAIPLMVLVGGLVVANVLGFSGRTTTESVSTARVALTDEAKWPFFDAIIARTAGIANDEALGRHLESEFSGVDFVVTTNIPDQLEAIVDITVEAESEEVTKAVAEAAATWVVDQGEVDRIDALNRDRDQMLAAIDDLDDSITAAGPAADQLAAQVDTAIIAADIERSKRELRLINDEIDRAQRSKLDLEVDVGALGRQLANLRSRTELVSLTTTSSTSEAPVTLALAGGIGAAILAAIGSLIYQREFGRITSTRQIEDVLGVPAGTYPVSQDSARLAGLFRSLESEVPVVVGVEHSPMPAALLGDFAQELTRIGFAAGVVTPAEIAEGNSPDKDISLIELSCEPEELSVSLDCDHALVVVDRKKDRMRHLRSRLETIQAIGVPVIGVLVVESR